METNIAAVSRCYNFTCQLKYQNIQRTDKLRKIRKPVGDTNEIWFIIIYLAAAGREELPGDRQKSYLAITRRDELTVGRQKSYLTTIRREELSGYHQKSYLAAARRVTRVSKITECLPVSPKP